MRKRNYRNILYFISTVILATLAIQIYWNFKNYKASKQQLINEVQISLDNAVDQYFIEITEKNIIGYIKPDSSYHINRRIKLDSLLKRIDYLNEDFKGLDSLDINKDTRVTIFNKGLSENHDLSENRTIKDAQGLYLSRRFLIKKDNDSIDKRHKTMSTEITVSVSQDSFHLEKIDALIKKELLRKNINVDYGLSYEDIFGKTKKINSGIIDSAILSTSSKSFYLPKRSTLELFFTNEKLAIFKKNLVGILLSFLLVGSVIACLLFLLRIINHQKQLAELKNDLISNITHEFKTPIATISAALEGIQNFNQENDPEKTEKYVKMSSNQLGKLNVMVEKILETATLDSDKLKLNLEEMYLVDHIKTITTKHQTNSPEKEVVFNSSHKNIRGKVDVFHFENAINNIIDNAIKYGGNAVEVNIKKTKSNIVIEITDSGKSLTKAHKEKIFEKFYRVPKGNTHDVKGFGIGLFYTKTIIEKHGGTIQLFLDKGLTNFKITLPNE